MKRNFKKIYTKAIAALMCATLAGNADAAVIEHIADRYIINVDQMDLNGDESLMDLLMMVPDVVSIDGKGTIDNELGKWAVRIDNVNISVNTAMFLKNTKAKEIKKIKVCVNPGIMKGCGGLKTVIDINYRKKEEGTSGKAAIEGDSYGNAELFVNNTIDKENLTFRTFVMGALEHKKNDEGIKSHAAEEDVKMHLNWDITSQDNLELFAAQNFVRERETNEPALFNRFYHVEGVYTRDLGNGAYGLAQAIGTYSHDNTVGKKTQAVDPALIFEFGFPFISKNVYMTTGIETGYSAFTDGVTDFTDKSRYEDGYIQVDWNLGKFNFSIGDRIRIENYWYSKPQYAMNFEKSFTNNHFTATSWVNINDNNIVQATFARRFLGSLQTVDGFYCNVKDIYKRPAYISELRYTYQKQDFNLMGIVKNTRQEWDNATHNNALMIGASSYMHMGALRLTAGVNYFHMQHNVSGCKEYNNYVDLKLAPQVSLEGWRFTSTMLYSSRKTTFERPANFYADVAVSKELNEKWLVEAKFHDMAGQHYGNRAVSIGATYYWGK